MNIDTNRFLTSLAHRLAVRDRFRLDGPMSDLPVETDFVAGSGIVPRRYVPEVLLKSGGLRPAAVIVLLYQRAGTLELVFTRRTSRVQHHKGQISFPGGGRDQEDHSAEATALREMHEEIGVEPGPVRLLGLLDDFPTNSRFAVTPVVGYLPEPPIYRHSEVEVDEVIEVPLGHLLDRRNRVDGWRSYGGQILPTFSYVAGPNVIWGVTGRILHGFLAIVEQIARDP